MAVNIRRLFNETLPAAMAKNPDAARQVGAKYQINITGEGGGEWFIDASDSGPRAHEGHPGGADCTITMAAEDFQKLLEDPQANGLKLFFAGRLKTSGNQMLALKLQKLFGLAG
jgi:putative sterol carrier protein